MAGVVHQGGSPQLRNLMVNEILGPLVDAKGEAFKTALANREVGIMNNIIEGKMDPLKPFQRATMNVAQKLKKGEVKLSQPNIGRLQESLTNLYEILFRDKKLQHQVGVQLGCVKGLAMGGAQGGRVPFQAGTNTLTCIKSKLQIDPDGSIAKIAEGPNNRIRNFARNIISKIPKGGRLGAILAGAGAVGLGAGALFGGSEAKAEEVIQEPGTTELEAQDIQVEEPTSMAYNATEGNFVNAEGEKETQPGVLNWIAENPTKSSLAALPLAMGAGFGLEKLSSKFGSESVARSGLKSAGKYLTGWKAFIPAMMIPHALHEYKAGYDLPEMVTNPINALWALGIRSPKNMEDVKRYYDNLKKGERGLNLTTLKGLKSVKGWKELPGNFKTAMMSDAATGTNLAFGKTFRKPFVATMKALGPEGGLAATQGAKAWGKKALLRAALIPAGILAATPAGWLTAGLLGADFLWDQYKDYRDGNIRIDEMRARGSISEDEADNYRSLILQGSIPFGVGNRMFGPDTMRIGEKI